MLVYYFFPALSWLDGTNRERSNNVDKDEKMVIVTMNDYTVPCTSTPLLEKCLVNTSFCVVRVRFVMCVVVRL